MIYIVGLFPAYVSVFFQAFGYRGRLFFFVALMALLLNSVFRGDVGTDTINYENIVFSFRHGLSDQALEPAFTILTAMLTEIVEADMLVVRAYSVLFFVIVALALCRATHNSMFFIGGYFIPAFAYPLSMNEIRFGLGVAIFYLSLSYVKKNFYIFFALFLLAIFFHYSLLLLGGLVYLLSIKYNRVSILGAMLILAAGAGFFFFLEDYIYSKLDIYSDYSSPSAWSGTSRVLSMIVLYIGFLLCGFERAIKVRMFVLVVIFAILFWFISLKSYAGLRLLEIIHIAFAFAIFALYEKRGLLLEREMKTAYLLSGFVTFVALYRGWMKFYGVGETPFLPYEFIGLSGAF